MPIRWLLCAIRREPPPQAFLCTDLDSAPVDILQWFVLLWHLEVTFQEVRIYLALETNGSGPTSQCRALLRRSFGLFSLVAFWAHDLAVDAPLAPRNRLPVPKRHRSFSYAMTP